MTQGKMFPLLWAVFSLVKLGRGGNNLFSSMLIISTLSLWWVWMGVLQPLLLFVALTLSILNLPKLEGSPLSVRTWEVTELLEDIDSFLGAARPGGHDQ